MLTVGSNESNSYGSFVIDFNEWTYAAAQGEFCIGIDNVRIGLYDGNGAVFPLFKWGMPSQDFFSLPRISCDK